MTCIINNNTENNTPRNDEYRPLSSQVISFIAESICGTLDTHQPSYHWDFVPLPELVFFVKKVTMKAKVDVYTAIAVLILVGRFKDNLPRNAIGEYGTTHKIFLSALLTALKEFKSKSRKDTACCSPTRCPSPSHDDLPLNSNYLEDPNSTCSSSLDLDQSHNILSSTPTSTLSISSMMSEEEDVHDMMSTNSHRNSFNYRNRCYSIVNQRLADNSGIYSLQDVNQMEREFLGLLGRDKILISDGDIREFVENNKCALGIYESIC